MYLRKIQLQGFKTFAHKTELEFQGGVSCIVGPNGSGKSNIADAVRWVLGEQSIKSLRGSKLEEVIFAGSDSKKPVNFAQVSLFIDNSDNSLPIEYSEISLTRKVHRSGESEYFINKTPCRLRDIQQLFLNTGLGRDTYSIVGQGEIEVIFFSHPVERRAIFEEASGINKYKYKKKEAQRRLQETSYNLTRLRDIIQEVSSQLAPLMEASGKAEEYQKISAELKETDVNYRLYQIKKLQEKDKKLNLDKEGLVNSIRFQQENLDKLEESLRKEKEKHFNLEGEMEKIQNELPHLAKEVEKIQGAMLVCEEKISYNIQKRQEIEEDIKNQKERENLIGKDIFSLEKNLQNAEKAYSHQKKEVEEDEQRILGQVKTLEVEIENLENKKNLAFEKVREQVLKNNQIMQIKKEIEIKSEENEKTKDNVLRTETTTQSLEEEICSLEESVLNVNEDLRQIGTTKNELFYQEEKINGDILKVRKERQEISQDLSSKESRLHTLLQLQYGSSEYALGSKSILGASHLVEKGIIGKISSLIKVPQEWERAIEVALGVSVQFIVCKDEEVAKDALFYLKGEKKGRATFIFANFFEGYQKEKLALPPVGGIIGWAEEIVEVAPHFRGLVKYLLSDFLVVENLEVGLQVLKEMGSENIKVLTREAEVLFTGTLSGGAHSREKLGALSIEREIEESKNEITKLKSKFTQKLKEEKQLIKTLDEIKFKIKEKDKEMHNQKDILHSMQTTLLLKKDEVKRCKNELETLKVNLTVSEEEIEALTVSCAKMEKEIEKIKLENDKLQEDILSLQNVIFENQKQKDKILENLTQRKVNFAVVEQKKDNQYQQLQDLREQEKIIQKMVIDKEVLLKNYEREEKEQREKIGNYELSLFSMEKGLKDKQNNLNVLRENKSLSYEVQNNEEKNISQLRREIEDLQNILHRIQIDQAQIETELREMINRLQDDYSLSPEEALLREEVSDVEHTAKAIKKLKNSLLSLGPVNLSSIEEYKTQKERHNFLTSQFEDVDKTYQIVWDLIKEFDVKAKYIFLDVFNKVGDSFDRVFQRLFGGGRAKLSLQNYQDVFESGVEIEVQIPGKKVQNIMLLSGGEKALVAISLLFAFLEVKPSPFCIFDEIDATLDDTNVRKFSHLLLEFSKSSQFVIITHAKGTMEVAQTLYGVTMEEEGISQLVSVKLEDRSLDGTIPQA